MPALPLGTALDRTSASGRPGGATRTIPGRPRKGQRQLFLWFNRDIWLENVRALVVELGGSDQLVAGGLAIEVPEARLSVLLDRLAEMMPARTAASVRYLVLPSDSAAEHRSISFGIDELAAVRTLYDHCAERHLRLVEQLAREGNFGVVFQPIFTASAEPALIGYEALLRVRRDDGSLSTPAELFLKASHFGIGAALDVIARRAVLSVLADTGHHGRIFLNVSGCFLTEKEALPKLLWQLYTARLDPSQIVLELTEWDGDQEAESLPQAVEEFRKAGFRIAIDDLGSGYSSLARLNTIRPDVVKIDRGLIQGIDENRYKLGILRSVVEMGRSIGAEIVAEGIETPGELETVIEMGIDCVQGYLLGRPQPCPWGAGSGALFAPDGRQ